MKLEHKETVAALCGGETIKENEIEEDPRNNSIISLLEQKRRYSTTTISCCNPCGLKFVNGTTKKDKSLEIHQQIHVILKVISQSYELPKCLECKVMFSNNEDLYNHQMTHDRNEIYPAEGMSHFVAVKFKESQSTSENSESSWKCGHCSNVNFQDETECIEHQMIVHSKQLICPFDYLEFTGIRGLGLFYNHMKNKHSEMFPQLSIFCSYCGEEFSNVFDKLTHMKTCDTKKYHCDHCQKTFFKKSQLIRHLKIVSGDISFICEICSKKCMSTMDLKLHHRKHTNEKTYQCSFPNCLKIFKTPAARSSHMEIHR
jgi:KRAB domain-containing zinc finger protein